MKKTQKKTKGIGYRILGFCFALVVSSMLIITSFATTAGLPSDNVEDYYMSSQGLQGMNLYLKRDTPATPNALDFSAYLADLGVYSVHHFTREYEQYIGYTAQDPKIAVYTYSSYDSSSSMIGTFITGVQYPDSPSTEIFLGANSRVDFRNMVINPSLSQGNLRFTNLVFDEYELGQEGGYNVLIFYIEYSGTILYPLTDGRFVELPFRIAQAYSADDILDLVDFDDYLFSINIAPSFLAFDNEHLQHNTQKYLTEDVYRLVYEQYNGEYTDGDITEELRAPDRLRTANLYFPNYSVSASVSKFEYTFDTTYCKTGNVYLSVPATLGGVAREGENFFELLENEGNKPVALEDFNFVRWIETIVMSFGSVEIFPGFYLLYPVAGAVSLALVVWVLKVFVGG